MLCMIPGHQNCQMILQCQVPFLFCQSAENENGMQAGGDRVKALLSNAIDEYTDKEIWNR